MQRLPVAYINKLLALLIPAALRAIDPSHGSAERPVVKIRCLKILRFAEDEVSACKDCALHQQQVLSAQMLTNQAAEAAVACRQSQSSKTEAKI
jgi:hypothetical protein